MLIKLNEWVRKNNNLGIPHRGTVIDNADPKKLGRLKVEIKNLLVGETEDLPWSYPNNSTGLGGKSDASGFIVPEIGNELVIVFPFKNIYHPVYIGYWQSELVHQTDFDEDYPETYGFRDKTGNIFKINKTVNYIEFVHKSGTKIMINNDGDMMFDIVGDLHWNIAGEEHKLCGGNIYSDSPVQRHQEGLSAPAYTV